MLARQEVNDAFRRLMTAEVDLAEGCLRAGLPLVRWMPPELQLDVVLFIHGGLSILKAVRQQNYDVWTSRPEVSRKTKLRLFLVCWWELNAGACRRKSRRSKPRTKHECNTEAISRFAPATSARCASEKSCEGLGSVEFDGKQRIVNENRNEQIARKLVQLTRPFQHFPFVNFPFSKRTTPPHRRESECREGKKGKCEK